MTRTRATVVWVVLAAALVVPLAIAATSPLLAWRQPVYIAAGFAGIVAMGLLLLQPLLAGGLLPGVLPRHGRRVHAWVGAGLVTAVVLHVAGLWLTSPPDVIDALLFRSPTPFSDWGVIAMWAIFATALLALFRRRIGPGSPVWRLGHSALAVVIVTGSVVHAMLIEGTMGTLSKAALCALVAAATALTLARLKPWAALTRRRSPAAPGPADRPARSVRSP